jgi:hypothetical protein
VKTREEGRGKREEKAGKPPRDATASFVIREGNLLL